MTVDEAIRDLLDVSTDIRRVVVLDTHGTVVGAGPRPAASGIGAAVERLWETAREMAATGEAALEHVVVELDGAAVFAVEAAGRRVVALAAPRPPVGLVLFDLRTCLADAFPAEAVPGEGE